MQNAINYNNAAVGSGSVVNDVLLTYDSYSQLSADYQAHSAAVNTSTTPKVGYAYADGSANTVRRTALTYPNGRVISLGYGASGGMNDALSRLDTIADAGPGGNTLANFAYLGMDTTVQLSYPEPGVQMTLIGSPAGDGGDQYVGLDRFGRLVDQRWTNAGATSDLERVQYGYDRASNRVWRANPVAKALSAKQDEFYVNDGLYQLSMRQQGVLNAGKTGISGTPTAEEDFSYDPTGNWNNYQVKAGGSSTLNQARTHNADNEIITLAGAATLVGYDQAGNMTKAPQPLNAAAAYTLTWDAWNRLVKVQNGSTLVASYAYDGLTRRTHSAGLTVNSGLDYFYSDQWKVLQVTPAATADGLTQFVWRGCDEDKLILRDTGGSSTTPHLYALDDGKNVTAVCDAAGAVQERYGYSGFGTPAFMTASFGSRTSSSYAWETLFCGYRFDSSTGIYQVRFRYLHSQLGRWLSRDPIQELGGYNLYCAFENLPTSKTDVDGLKPEDAKSKEDCEKCKGYHWKDKPNAPPIKTDGCSYPAWLAAIKTLVIDHQHGGDNNNPTGKKGCSFLDACNNHDKCYQTCGSDKKQCDTALFNAMLAVCKQCDSGPGMADRPCANDAQDIHDGVNNLGGSSFKDDQDKRCGCQKSP